MPRIHWEDIIQVEDHSVELPPEEWDEERRAFETHKARVIEWLDFIERTYSGQVVFQAIVDRGIENCLVDEKTGQLKKMPISIDYELMDGSVFDFRPDRFVGFEEDKFKPAERSVGLEYAEFGKTYIGDNGFLQYPDIDFLFHELVHASGIFGDYEDADSEKERMDLENKVVAYVDEHFRVPYLGKSRRVEYGHLGDGTESREAQWEAIKIANSRPYKTYEQLCADSPKPLLPEDEYSSSAMKIRFKENKETTSPSDLLKHSPIKKIEIEGIKKQ